MEQGQLGRSSIPLLETMNSKRQDYFEFAKHRLNERERERRQHERYTMLVTKRVGLASLENDCDTLSTTDTSSSDCVSFVESMKVVYQVGSDTCSTCSERMSESC